jgi:BolA family transcriptional regulator, general stress-responsive regulator
MTKTTETALRERLLKLEPTMLEIDDESHEHAGHAGNQSGASHFRVWIEAACFEGKPKVAQHRLVYDLVNDLMPFPIHALALQTSVPSKGNS